MARQLVSEFVDTDLLLTAVVGSGIMGDRLSGGNVAIALLANSFATGAALVVLFSRLVRFRALISILRYRRRTRVKVVSRG